MAYTPTTNCGRGPEGIGVVSKRTRYRTASWSSSKYLANKWRKKRADERTRTADLLITSEIHAPVVRVQRVRQVHGIPIGKQIKRTPSWSARHRGALRPLRLQYGCSKSRRWRRPWRHAEGDRPPALSPAARNSPATGSGGRGDPSTTETIRPSLRGARRQNGRKMFCIPIHRPRMLCRLVCVTTPWRGLYATLSPRICGMVHTHFGERPFTHSGE